MNIGKPYSDNIHGSAVISDGAEIEEGVSIGPFSVIGPNVKIGKGTKIHPHVVIDGYTTIGRDNEIFPFASIGMAPQDLKYAGEPSTLQIGDNNKIREYVTIQPGTSHGLMKTVVGSSNLFMANSHVGHDCIIGSNNVIANSVAIAGHVTVENHVILGGLVGIHQFTRIGSLALIGGGAMVNLDIPPYCLAQGDRCSIRGLNLIGLQRAGFSKEDISFIKKSYRHFFSTVGHLRAKLDTFPRELSQNERANALVEFIVNSKRGISEPSRPDSAKSSRSGSLGADDSSDHF